MTLALGVAGHWLPVHDGDDRARAIYHRHYSVAPWRVRRNLAAPRAQKYVGPGQYMALLTAGCDALFVWRRERYRRDGQTGVNCSIFRNEGPVLSSTLIREADELAWARWPGERHFTFVDPTAIRSSNPGCCFLHAGWARLPERTKGGLVILERWPEAER